MLPAIQEELDRRYVSVRWPDDADAREACLAEHGPAVRAVATSGHLGIDPALAERLPQLGIVAVNGVGYDRIDVKAMAARGVRVSNTPDVLTDDVADLAIALMLNAMRALPAAERHLRDGKWPAGDPPLARRASGLRYGIVGLGRIGQAIAGRLQGFGGSIAYTGPRRKQGPHAFHDTVHRLAAESDVLFVATVASAETRHLIDASVLDALGPDGVLVNVSRGSVVDEEALVAALRNRTIWGAGLDVFAAEPHVPPELLELERVALAPHVGSATAETRAAMGRLMLDNLAAFFDGRELPTPVV
ncbi:MAG: 2-hydroxyacid dehydrogenase [Gluconacetobacter diazotrophicus]|nr:2-hydroxyacid dehydrogenase [Gluconacetobacter diazotrophicus]